MTLPLRMGFRYSNHQELDLDRLQDLPTLKAVHDVWAQTMPDRVPARIDPLSIPRQLLPYVMLLDLEEKPVRLRIRLAGTFVCERHGGELRGMTTDHFFQAHDAQAVIDSALEVARSKRPSLAYRESVTLSERFWRYTRLILPLSSDGKRVDGFFKVLDPDSLSWAMD